MTHQCGVQLPQRGRRTGLANLCVSNNFRALAVLFWLVVDHAAITRGTETANLALSQGKDRLGTRQRGEGGGAEWRQGRAQGLGALGASISVLDGRVKEISVGKEDELPSSKVIEEVRAAAVRDTANKAARSTQKANRANKADLQEDRLATSRQRYISARHIAPSRCSPCGAGPRSMHLPRPPGAGPPTTPGAGLNGLADAQRAVSTQPGCGSLGSCPPNKLQTNTE